MLAIKYLLMMAGWGAIAVAVAVTTFDLYLLLNYRRLLAGGKTENLPIPRPVRWRWGARLVALALVPMLLSEGIVVIPSGSAGVRVSQISGTLPGTLYPGAHFVMPLVQQVAEYDTREMVYSTATA